MALETLKKKRIIQNQLITHHPSEKSALDPSDQHPHPPSFIKVDHDKNEITFKIQNGPIKENGENGCQVIDLVNVFRVIIEEFNQEFLCEENIAQLFFAHLITEADHLRTKRREQEKTEGTNKETPHASLTQKDLINEMISVKKGYVGFNHERLEKFLEALREVLRKNPLFYTLVG